MLCKFCQSPQRAELEAAISTGQISKKEAAKRLNCGRDAIYRHLNNHLTEAVGERLKEDSEVAHVVNVLNALTEARDKALCLYKESLTIVDPKDKIRTALKAIREDVRVLEAIAKVTGQSGPDTQVTVFNADTIKQVQVILQVLEKHPEIPDYVVDEMTGALRGIED